MQGFVFSVQKYWDDRIYPFLWKPRPVANTHNAKEWYQMFHGLRPLQMKTVVSMMQKPPSTDHLTIVHG